MDIDIYTSTNKYEIIYTDPPWELEKAVRKCRPKQTKDLDYPTLGIGEIKKIHEAASALCAEKSNVFMWTVDKHLAATEKMMAELGFLLHTRMIWDKCNGIACAFTIRFSHEYLLWFYKKGGILRPVEEARGKYTSVIRTRSTVHSHKPDIVYSMFDTMFPNARKLELFARNHRRGWDCWGNQTSLFDSAQINNFTETVANGERKPYVGTVRTHRDCGTGKARLSLWD